MGSGAGVGVETGMGSGLESGIYASILGWSCAAIREVRSFLPVRLPIGRPFFRSFASEKYLCTAGLSGKVHRLVDGSCVAPGHLSAIRAIQLRGRLNLFATSTEVIGDSKKCGCKEKDDNRNIQQEGKNVKRKMGNSASDFPMHPVPNSLPQIPDPELLRTVPIPRHQILIARHLPDDAPSSHDGYVQSSACDVPGS